MSHDQEVSFEKSCRMFLTSAMLTRSKIRFSCIPYAYYRPCYIWEWIQCFDSFTGSEAISCKKNVAKLRKNECELNLCIVSSFSVNFENLAYRYCSSNQFRFTYLGWIDSVPITQAHKKKKGNELYMWEYYLYGFWAAESEPGFRISPGPPSFPLA